MIEVTAIFDVGKTNKKLLLVDAKGAVLRETIRQFAITTDDEGYGCENINVITKWVKREWKQLLTLTRYKVVAVNFAAYGASFVHIGKNNKPVAPLYDYLRPLPEKVIKGFYAHVKRTTKQDLQQFTQHTCSPKLDLLNSGLQLYWIKNFKPKLWAEIKWSLHLPQYLSSLISGKHVSEYTSIGCHTALWDFRRFCYSAWITPDIASKLAPITTERFCKVTTTNSNGSTIKVGHGLHDSSSALIPYLHPSNHGFILISTGTWSIQLNPFNARALTAAQLQKDCVCYLRTDGTQVKASRLLLGKEHDYQVSRIATYFSSATGFEKALVFDATCFWKVQTIPTNKFYPACMKGSGPMPKAQKLRWDLFVFKTENEAYHSLIIHLVSLLKVSIQLVDTSRVTTLFVDGGFANNDIFMNVLANSFHRKKIIASYVPQSTALGAFFYLHNRKGINKKYFNRHFKTYKRLESGTAKAKQNISSTISGKRK